MAKPRNRDEEIAELEARASELEGNESVMNSSSVQTSQRVRALAQFAAGANVDDVADAVGNSRSAVQRWWVIYKKHGLEAVENMRSYKPVPKCMLDAIKEVEREGGGWNSVTEIRKALKEKFRWAPSHPTLYTILREIRREMKEAALKAKAPKPKAVVDVPAAVPLEKSQEVAPATPSPEPDVLTIFTTGDYEWSVAYRADQDPCMLVRHLKTHTPAAWPADAPPWKDWFAKALVELPDGRVASMAEIDEKGDRAFGDQSATTGGSCK